jgi:hypothetical protein
MHLATSTSYGSLLRIVFHRSKNLFFVWQESGRCPGTIIASSLTGYPWPGLERVHRGAEGANTEKLVEKIRW